jgi:hypothetical protein
MAAHEHPRLDTPLFVVILSEATRGLSGLSCSLTSSNSCGCSRRTMTFSQVPFAGPSKGASVWSRLKAWPRKHVLLLTTSIIALAIGGALVFICVRGQDTHGIPTSTFVPLCTAFASLFGVLTALTIALISLAVQSAFNTWHTNTASLLQQHQLLRQSDIPQLLHNYPSALRAHEMLQSISLASATTRHEVNDWRKTMGEIVQSAEAVSKTLLANITTCQQSTCHDITDSPPGDIPASSASSSSASQVYDEARACKDLSYHIVAITQARVSLEGASLYLTTARRLSKLVAVFACGLVYSVACLIVGTYETPEGPALSNLGRLVLSNGQFLFLIVGALLFAAILYSILHTASQTLPQLAVPPGEPAG